MIFLPNSHLASVFCKYRLEINPSRFYKSKEPKIYIYNFHESFMCNHYKNFQKELLNIMQIYKL